MTDRITNELFVRAAMTRYATLVTPKQLIYRTLVIVVLIRDASRQPQRETIWTCVPRRRKNECVSSDTRYRRMSRAIYPYRFGFDLNRGEVKRRRRNTHDTRIRSGSGEIHYHIRPRRKSRRGERRN